MVPSILRCALFKVCFTVLRTHTHKVVLSTSITLQDALRGWMSLPCLYASTSERREGQEKGKGGRRRRRRKRGGAGEGRGEGQEKEKREGEERD